ncbi:MAG TPA: C45 family peptidase [Methanospirillum sp.]|nr:C45 family peptidase [Methanospirillum sp.]
MIPTDTFEKGRRYEKNGLVITELHGNYREMGRQYGALYRTELAEILAIIKTEFTKKPGVTISSMQKRGNDGFDTYPQRYKEIVYGIVETSNLSIDDIRLINVMELYIPFVAMGWTGCSGFAAWGPYTSDGGLIFGRNYDYSPSMTKYTAVTVFNPTDGSIPVATIGYIGLIYLTTGMNKEKQFLELNMGAFSGGAFRRTDRTAGAVSLLSVLEDGATPDQISSRLQSITTDAAFVINTASPEGAVPYEWTSWTMKRRAPDRDGIVVGTNHFVDPSWGINQAEPHSLEEMLSGDSVWRRQNLLSFADKNKGSITFEKIQTIISTPLEEGGVFMAPDTTSYQIMAVPEELKIWVRIPQIVDWTEVDLKPLFS